MKEIFHSLVLNLHQPSGNLIELLNKPNPKGEDGWECKEILFTMDRIARSLWEHEDRGRVQLSMSGTLLEALLDPEFQERVYGVVKLGDLLWHFQNRKIIEVLGTGYYHPVIPLIPKADWEEHIIRWKGIGSHVLGRDDFHGFWPPEMGFCMEMIPMLKKHGYRYVVVDSNNVEPVTPMEWHELRYRPHIAKHDGEEIIVVVRDRDLSNAQESGMELGWFMNEVTERTAHCDFAPLITTCTDGDNGGWFRNFRDQSNFWNAFYIPLLEQGPSDVTVTPSYIHDYIDQHGAEGEVKVHTAAWNTGEHDGVGFVQWTGSDIQKDALNRVKITSDAIQELIKEANHHVDFKESLEEARWRLLRAQTSCNFFWGEAWVERCHHDLDSAWNHIDHMRDVVKYLG